MRRLTASLLLLGVTGAQDKKVDHTLRDFGRFPEEIQHSLVRNLERRIQLDPNPASQRIVSMQRDRSKLPLADDAPYHLAQDWAKGHGTGPGFSCHQTSSYAGRSQPVQASVASGECQMSVMGKMPSAATRAHSGPELASLPANTT